jgi:pyruvate kinase
MILISNNVKGKILLDEKTVIRINIAWVKTKEELENIIQNNMMHEIYLDYPEGRNKPPKPTLSLQDGIDFANKYDNIKYFAISNAEEKLSLSLIRRALPNRIKIVPKIETIKGVLNILEVVEACRTDTVMLDKEDLYTDVDKNSLLYEHFIDTLRTTCRNHNITVLELQGVIFYAKP